VWGPGAGCLLRALLLAAAHAAAGRGARRCRPAQRALLPAVELLPLADCRAARAPQAELLDWLVRQPQDDQRVVYADTALACGILEGLSRLGLY
jgi:hypothetical protein